MQKEKKKKEGAAASYVDFIFYSDVKDTLLPSMGGYTREQLLWLYRAALYSSNDALAYHNDLSS